MSVLIPVRCSACGTVVRVVRTSSHMRTPMTTVPAQLAGIRPRVSQNRVPEDRLGPSPNAGWRSLISVSAPDRRPRAVVATAGNQLAASGQSTAHRGQPDKGDATTRNGPATTR